MGYVQNNLLHDEHIISWTRPHWIVYGPSVLLFFFALILTGYLPSALNALSGFHLFGMSIHHFIVLAVFIIAIFYGIKALIMHQTSEYSITDKRIMMKTGWIQRRSIEIFLDKVEAIYVDQSVTGRIFDYGTIIIVGTGGSKDPFLFVPKPLMFRKQAQEQIDSDEERRRRY